MRAVVYDPQARANLRLADVGEPVVAASEALIQVRAIALNFGEVHFIDQMRKPGEVPGWDASGVVLKAAPTVQVHRLAAGWSASTGLEPGRSFAPCRRKPCTTS